MTLPAGIRVAWREVPPETPRRRVSRALLAELLPGAVVVSRCASCGGDHGRVRVRGRDAAVSVSYVPGWTVVAVTREHPRIGVDAVPSDTAGLDRILLDAPTARAWARAEAVLKADGRGLAVDPGRVEVRPSADGWRARIRVPGDEARAWHGWDLAGPGGIVIAVTVPEEATPAHGAWR